MAEAPPGKGRCARGGGSLAPGPGPLPAPGTGVRTHGRPHPRGVPSTDGVGTGGGGGSRIPIPSSQSPRSANAPNFCQTSLFSLPRTRRSASPLSPGLYFFFFPSGILRSPLESGPFSSRFGWEKGIPSSPPPLLPPLAPTRSRRVPGSSEEPAPGTAPRSSASSRPAASPFAGGRVGKRDRFCPPGTPSGSGRRPENRNGPGGLGNSGTQLPSRRLPRRRARPVVGDWEI